MGKRRLLLGLVFFLLFAADSLLKFFVQDSVPLMRHSSLFYPYGGMGIFQNFAGVEFSIVHVMNKGAAWGMFASWQFLLQCVRIAVVTGIIAYLLTSLECLKVFPDRWLKGNESKQLPLTLVVAGAVGNIIDYFVYGHVIDMFYFKFGSYSYPIFNVADSCIFVGICMLLYQSWQEKRLASRSESSL